MVVVLVVAPEYRTVGVAVGFVAVLRHSYLAVVFVIGALQSRFVVLSFYFLLRVSVERISADACDVAFFVVRTDMSTCFVVPL